jgi:hypothetical protein
MLLRELVFGEIRHLRPSTIWDAKLFIWLPTRCPRLVLQDVKVAKHLLSNVIFIKGQAVLDQMFSRTPFRACSSKQRWRGPARHLVSIHF